MCESPLRSESQRALADISAEQTRNQIKINMKFSIYLVLLFLLPNQIYCQDTIVKYYNNDWLEKEVEAKKAKTIKKEYNNEDGSKTTQILKAKDLSIIRSYTIKDKQPYGIWTIQYGKGTKELDYNFDVKYIAENCEDKNPFKATSYIKDIEAEKYIAPKLEQNKDLTDDILSMKLIYPTYAIENEIQGTVEVCFTINELGVKENLTIIKGVHYLLDKEAARVVNETKFETSAKLNEIPIPICIKMPITFRLE